MIFYIYKHFTFLNTMAHFYKQAQPNKWLCGTSTGGGGR